MPKADLVATCDSQGIKSTSENNDDTQPMCSKWLPGFSEETAKQEPEK
jgi:hypothetical protein